MRAALPNNSPLFLQNRNSTLNASFAATNHRHQFICRDSSVSAHFINNSISYPKMFGLNLIFTAIHWR